MKTLATSPVRAVGTIAVWFVALVLAYVIVGNALHRWAFPLPPPDTATYPRAGDRFGSSYEGFEQHVLAVQDGWIVGELLIKPGAVGPPLHFHKSFTETFHVREGTLHIELEDRVITLGPGESFVVPPLTPHRPFNPGTEPVVVASDQPILPQSFAACLVQIYPILDRSRGASLDLMLQMSIADPICDTHLAEAPAAVVNALYLVLAPAARLLGYTNYDAARSLHPPGL
jgi:hypothetical protein